MQSETRGLWQKSRGKPADQYSEELRTMAFKHLSSWTADDKEFQIRSFLDDISMCTNSGWLKVQIND